MWDGLRPPLVLFRAEHVPAIRNFDAGVSAIRYTVELNAIDALAEAETVAVLDALCGVTQ